MQSPTHTKPNQKPTLIDLIFSQDEQTITNMATSAPLGKSHHKVLRFHYTVDNNLKDERRRRYLYDRANYDDMKLELQRIDWYEVFYNSSSLNVKEIINNLISKFVPIQMHTPKKNKSIWMNKLILKIKVKKKNLSSVLENERPELPDVC